MPHRVDIGLFVIAVVLKDSAMLIAC